MDESNYSDDNAMDYEYLLRQAHQVGRHGVQGADADTFRKLLGTAANYKEKKTEKALIDYMVRAGEISAYIKGAIFLVMSKLEGKLSDAQYQELEEVMMSLHEPNLENINQAVSRAEKVFLEIGLKPK